MKLHLSRFDLRWFFGGMQAYHDWQRMAQVLGINTQFSFVSDFVDGRNGQVDLETCDAISRICLGMCQFAH